MPGLSVLCCWLPRDHRWAPVPGNPYAAPGSVEGDRAATAVTAMRAHKGIIGPIPTAADLGDKL
jgi:hypothetical protein